MMLLCDSLFSYLKQEFVLLTTLLVDGLLHTGISRIVPKCTNLYIKGRISLYTSVEWFSWTSVEWFLMFFFLEVLLFKNKGRKTQGAYWSTQQISNNKRHPSCGSQEKIIFHNKLCLFETPFRHVSSSLFPLFWNPWQHRLWNNILCKWKDL